MGQGGVAKVWDGCLMQHGSEVLGDKVVGFGGWVVIKLKEMKDRLALDGKPAFPDLRW